MNSAGLKSLAKIPSLRMVLAIDSSVSDEAVLYIASHSTSLQDLVIAECQSIIIAFMLWLRSEDVDEVVIKAWISQEEAAGKKVPNISFFSDAAIHLDWELWGLFE